MAESTTVAAMMSETTPLLREEDSPTASYHTNGQEAEGSGVPEASESAEEVKPKVSVVAVVRPVKSHRDILRSA